MLTYQASEPSSATNGAALYESFLWNQAHALTSKVVSIDARERERQKTGFFSRDLWLAACKLLFVMNSLRWPAWLALSSVAECVAME
jgi:hypothetical protein